MFQRQGVEYEERLQEQVCDAGEMFAEVNMTGDDDMSFVESDTFFVSSCGASVEVGDALAAV